MNLQRAGDTFFSGSTCNTSVTLGPPKSIAARVQNVFVFFCETPSPHLLQNTIILFVLKPAWPQGCLLRLGFLKRTSYFIGIRASYPPNKTLRAAPSIPRPLKHQSRPNLSDHALQCCEVDRWEFGGCVLLPLEARFWRRCALRQTGVDDKFICPFLRHNPRRRQNLVVAEAHTHQICCGQLQNIEAHAQKAPLAIGVLKQGPSFGCCCHLTCSTRMLFFFLGGGFWFDFDWRKKYEHTTPPRTVFSRARATKYIVGMPGISCSKKHVEGQN